MESLLGEGERTIILDSVYINIYKSCSKVLFKFNLSILQSPLSCNTVSVLYLYVRSQVHKQSHHK